jgi:hypothetical protein
MSSRRPKKEWLKQLQKRKRKRFEGLTSKLEHGPLAGSKLVIEPAGREKMSVVLEDFVEPYRSPNEGSIDDYRKLLSLGVLAWNAALMSDDIRKSMIDDVISKVLTHEPDEVRAELRAHINAMVERKLAHFASIRRAIVSFEVTDTGRDYHLSVASTLEA